MTCRRETSLAPTWHPSRLFMREYCEGMSEAILIVLSALGVEVSDEERTRITTCRDSDLLAIWARRAGATESTDDIFRIF